MKPTGTPMIAAGAPTPSSNSSSRRNSAVGALPTATTEPGSLSRHSSSAAADRVVPIRSASPGTFGSDSVHSTSLAAGKRLRVTPEAIMFASHRIGAPASSAARPDSTTSRL